MQAALYSNFLNHHQFPFCLAMDRLTKGQFTFVATTPVPDERLEMGYHDMNGDYPFVLRAYESAQNREKALALALDCDVIITGSAPEIYTKMRVQKNKLTFRYSERVYKEGLRRAARPRNIASKLIYHTRYLHKPLYMLCSSAYTAFDFALTGSYLGKTYKWGYFPEVKAHDMDALFFRKSADRRASILWAGRMIELKHPEACLTVARRLKSHGISFDMSLIGRGPLEAELRGMIDRMQLEDCVHMLGSMSPEEVRSHMESADIYLFTSDFNEGWGAVLNEAMNSGCAVVASHAIGSAPFLIEDGRNGFIYRSGDTDGLYDRILKLIEQPRLRQSMGRNACRTMEEVWNADVAAKRLIDLSQNLLEGKRKDLFREGPCSRAGFLKNGWYHG